MEWFNPVEWVAWLYGKFFQHHVYTGGAMFVALFAILGLVLWARGVDKYKEEHPPKLEAVATASSTPALVTATGVSQADSENRKKHKTNIATNIKPKTPEIRVEQHSEGSDSPNAVTFGDNSPITISPKLNPYSKTVFYDFNGVEHTDEGVNHTTVVGAEFDAFNKLKDLLKNKDWVAMKNLSEEQITKTPQWLTPYFFSGIASANLGKKEEAIKRLEYVEQKADGNSDYGDASRYLNLLRHQR